MYSAFGVDHGYDEVEKMKSSYKAYQAIRGMHAWRGPGKAPGKLPRKPPWSQEAKGGRHKA